MSYPLRATNEEIITAYRETGSVWKAAEKLGLCGQSVHERLRALGVALCNKPWTDEETAAAKWLAENGTPIGRIAERLGRTYAGVTCQLRRHGVKHPYKPKRKPKRASGNKRDIRKFADYLLRTGYSVNRAVRAQGRAITGIFTVTGIVNALQQHAPEQWAQYVSSRKDLPAPKECVGCGNIFQPLTKKQKACTTKCGDDARRDAHYFGGRRREAIGLAEGVCQLCEARDKSLSAHHLLGKDNDPKNESLVALCTGCHQLVGILGRRRAADEPAFWENLIGLAIARAWADKGRTPDGVHVSVSIEELGSEDLWPLSFPPALDAQRKEER